MKNLTPPWRLLLAIGCSDLLFMVPVVIAYYQMKGVNLAGFLLIQGIFRLAVLVLEVPTGYLADRWSRTQQLTLGAAVWLVGLTCVWQAHSFTGLLVGELFLALSVALYSGTTQAYLHEALHYAGRDKEQATWQGRLFASSTGAEVLAGVAGGFLFTWWADAPILAAMVAATAALALTATLPSLPKQKATRRHNNPLRDLYLVAHHSLRIHPKLPSLLFGTKSLLGLTGVLFWLMQAKLFALQVSPAMLGVAFACYMAIKTLLALCAGKFAQLGEARVFRWLVVCLVVGCLLMTLDTPWAVWLGGVLTAGVVHAIGGPLSTTIINREVENHERATILSVGGMISLFVSGVFLIVATPLLGFISLNALMLGYLACTLLLCAYPIWRLRD